MELLSQTVSSYSRYACQQMAKALDRFDDETVNIRPFGDGTNSAAALIVHACSAAEYWFEHIGIGRPIDRDRDAEFEVESTTADLRVFLSTMERRLDALAAELDAGPTATEHELRVFSPDGDSTDGSVVLHALQELFQHLGHLEITADAVGSPAG
jgi:hypothetical protein